MAILRCTKKLLTELKRKPVEITTPPDAIGDWHANLIRVDRRKCVLFTHDRTLFSLFVPGLTKPDFVRIEDIFGQRLFKSLLSEGFSQAQIELFLDDLRDIQFAKTNNRSILGSMTDLAFQINFSIDHYGGLARADITELNHELNRIPMSAIEQIHAIEELRMLVSG